MPRAIIDGTVLAVSDRTEQVEGNHYFPRDAVDMGRFDKGETRYACPWKGDAVYYDYVSDEGTIRDVAWS